MNWGGGEASRIEKDLLICIFNAGPDKRQYYRTTLSLSSDAVPQFGDFFNIEQEN